MTKQVEQQFNEFINDFIRLMSYVNSIHIRDYERYEEKEVKVNYKLTYVRD